MSETERRWRWLARVQRAEGAVALGILPGAVGLIAVAFGGLTWLLVATVP